jgi:HPt (histidine-containing phosphotransfer) domain-containing protein
LPVFDAEDFLRRMMGDESLVRKVLAAFLGDMPAQISKLRTLIAERAAEAAGKQAHTIKGAARNVGGMALGEVAARIEAAGKTGNLEAVIAELPEVERQFATLREAVLGSRFVSEP